jgi:RsiW-degrading membrane proteinase PrsW (M82 family)
MLTDIALRGSVGLIPVLLFLAALVYLDSYKLVHLRSVLETIVFGCLAAAASYVVNVTVLSNFSIELIDYSRYFAPLIEEFLKGLILVHLIRRNRIGFPVDSAIFGFAAGAGFAMIENLYYLNMLVDSHLAVWILRGFGTAIMHGGTTAIFGIIAHTLAEERQSTKAYIFIPGFLTAVMIHSVFNHFLFAPVWSTLGILLLFPPVIIIVFQESEKSLRRWMQIDFDADAELLELISSGEFSQSKVGKFLGSLRGRFRGEVVADMFCYLRLHIELSMRATGMLMMRESGFPTEPHPEVQGMLDELRYLEKSIGRTGRRTMKPFLRLSPRDLWQIYMLEEK